MKTEFPCFWTEVLLDNIRNFKSEALLFITQLEMLTSTELSQWHFPFHDTASGRHAFKIIQALSVL